MSAIDDELARLDQEIADADTAAQRAKELQMNPGDYDLRSATAGARAERQKQEALAEMQKVIEAEKAMLRSQIEQGFQETLSQKPNIAEEVDPTGISRAIQQPDGLTKSRHIQFDVGGTPYTLVEDTDDVRRMIRYDNSGNVRSDSPVIPMGVNESGGFILASRKDGDIKKALVPFTQQAGSRVETVNYPQAKGEPERVGRLLSSGASWSGDLIDPEAAEAIRGLNLQ